jgi:hypothetical protein
MEGHLEALLEMNFCTEPPNFGVEAHMEAPAGDALSSRLAIDFAWEWFVPFFPECKHAGS